MNDLATADESVTPSTRADDERCQPELTILRVSGSDNTEVSAINGAGEVAGNYWVDAAPRSFIWSSQSGYLTFAVPDAMHTHAADIANDGSVAGTYVGADLQEAVFLRDSARTYSTFQPIEDSAMTVSALTDQGDIVGHGQVGFVVNGFKVLFTADIATFDVKDPALTGILDTNVHASVVGHAVLDDHQQRTATPVAPCSTLRRRVGPCRLG